MKYRLPYKTRFIFLVSFILATTIGLQGCGSNLNQVTTLSQKQRTAYVNALFGGKSNTITLKEVVLERRTLKFRWLIGRDTQDKYCSFVQVLDEKGALVAESDSELRIAKTLDNTFESRNSHDLFGKASDYASSGTYTIQIGVYDMNTGEKLPFVDSTGGVYFVAKIVWLSEEVMPTVSP